MPPDFSDEALQDSLAVRLVSIRRSRYWMNITDIGEALHDLRPAVIDLIALLEEVQQQKQKPETLLHDPSYDSDIALLKDTTDLLARLGNLMKQQDAIHPTK